MHCQRALRSHGVVEHDPKPKAKPVQMRQQLMTQKVGLPAATGKEPMVGFVVAFAGNAGDDQSFGDRALGRGGEDPADGHDEHALVARTG